MRPRVQKSPRLRAGFDDGSYLFAIAQIFLDLITARVITANFLGLSAELTDISRFTFHFGHNGLLTGILLAHGWLRWRSWL